MPAHFALQCFMVSVLFVCLLQHLAQARLERRRHFCPVHRAELSAAPWCGRLETQVSTRLLYVVLHIFWLLVWDCTMMTRREEAWPQQRCTVELGFSFRWDVSVISTKQLNVCFGYFLWLKKGIMTELTIFFRPVKNKIRSKTEKWPKKQQWTTSVFCNFVNRSFCYIKKLRRKAWKTCCIRS